MKTLRSPAVVETAVAATVVAFAAALRVVGSGSGLPLPLLNPDETNIVPRAWELVHGGGLDPGWYDYPSLLFLLLAPVPDRARRPLLRDRAGRGDRDRPRRRGHGVVARAGDVRACRRPDRRRRGRRRYDARRVLADGGHGHPAHRRRDRVPGAARHGSARVGGRRRGARRVREVSGGAARRAAPRRRLRPLAQNRSRPRSRRRGVRRREPVRARARGRRLGRRHAGQPPRTRGLARLRGRSCDAVRVLVAAVGDGRAARPRRTGRRGCRRAPTRATRSRAPLVRRRVLPLAAPDRGALRPVRAAARPHRLRACRRDSAARGRGARRVSRSALVVRRRHRRTHRPRQAPRRCRLDRPSRAPAGDGRRGPVDPATAGTERDPARAPRAGAPLRPQAEPRGAPCPGRAAGSSSPGP